MTNTTEIRPICGVVGDDYEITFDEGEVRYRLGSDLDNTDTDRGPTLRVDQWMAPHTGNRYCSARIDAEHQPVHVNDVSYENSTDGFVVQRIGNGYADGMTVYYGAEQAMEIAEAMMVAAMRLKAAQKAEA
jgi:hypothetical protein